MAKGKIWVGTSGWSYPHWKGRFYPKGLKSSEEFRFYSLFFNTVELNNPFYKLPSRETFENWRRNSKDNFLFVVKASRFITHMKKLKDTKEAVRMFLDHCDGLEGKLGPVLFQLPPGWRINTERLETFLENLPGAYRFAFEFREPSWYTEEVYALLKEYNCAFCIYQLAGHLSPLQVTADWVYLRLHGPTKNKYQGSFDFKTLQSWADESRMWQKAGKDVFIYFDNDDSGYAAFNAQVIEMMLNKTDPITEQESKVMAILINAIKEKNVVRFTDTLKTGSGYRSVEPYFVAIDKKGKGDLFFSGYEYPEKKAGGASTKQRNGLQRYRLSDINLKTLKVLKRSFNGLHETVQEEAVFGMLPLLRIVYRVAPCTSKDGSTRRKEL